MKSFHYGLLLFLVASTHLDAIMLRPPRGDWLETANVFAAFIWLLAGLYFIVRGGREIA